MNCDASLTFLDRWDLQISDPACRKEFAKVQFEINPFALIKTSGCRRQQDIKRKSPTKDPNGHNCEVLGMHCGHICDNQLCNEGYLHELLQCQSCSNLPIFAKQCSHCSRLTCKDCYDNSPTCRHCTHATSQQIKLIEIKDIQLKKILGQLIKYKHKCTENGKTRIFTSAEMKRHYTSEDCPSKRYKCFCQSAHDKKRYSLTEIFEHLRTECPDVMMHCQFCHSSCSHSSQFKISNTLLYDDSLIHYKHCENDEKNDSLKSHQQAFLTRAQLRKHKCYLDTRDLDQKFLIREFRLRKIAAIYEKGNLNCQQCQTKDHCLCEMCKPTAPKVHLAHTMTKAVPQQNSIIPLQSLYAKDLGESEDLHLQSVNTAGHSLLQSPAADHHPNLSYLNHDDHNRVLFRKFRNAKEASSKVNIQSKIAQNQHIPQVAELK